MKWLEAFYRNVDKPKWTNREAAGLIRFARSIVNTYSKEPNVSLTPWDWYAYALPALGWSKAGDKFKVDTKHQLQEYPAFVQLRAALVTMTSELDEAGVPFRVLVDPRGSDAVFRQLAKDAWDVMQRLQQGGQPPDPLGRVWEGVTFPEEGAAASAATALPKPKKPKKEPEQVPLPGILPAEPMTPKKAGGGLWLLLLLALGSKRKRGTR